MFGLCSLAVRLKRRCVLVYLRCHFWADLLNRKRYFEATVTYLVRICRRSCGEDTQSDYVEFSNFNVELMDRKMRRMCGTKSSNKREVTSDGNFFRVTFKTNDAYDATGFEASYQFRKHEGSYLSTKLTTTKQHCTIISIQCIDKPRCPEMAKSRQFLSSRMFKFPGFLCKWPHIVTFVHQGNCLLTLPHFSMSTGQCCWFFYQAWSKRGRERPYAFGNKDYRGRAR